MEKRTEKTEDFIDLTEIQRNINFNATEVKKNIERKDLQKKIFKTSDGYSIMLPQTSKKRQHLLKGHKKTKDNNQKRKRRNKYIFFLEEIIKNSKFEKVTANSKRNSKPEVENYIFFKTNIKIQDKIYTLRIVTEDINKKHAPPEPEKKDAESSFFPENVDFQERLKPTWKSDSGQRAYEYNNTFPEKKSSFFYIYDIYETKFHIIRDKNQVITPVQEKNSDTAITPENFTVYFKNLLDTGKYGKNPVKIAAVCLKMAEESGGKENKERIAEWLKKQGCTSGESTKKFFEEFAKQSISQRTNNKHQDCKNPGKEKDKNNEYNRGW